MARDDAQSLLLTLKNLENKVSGKIMRKALRAGAKVCQQQMKADAPVKSGATRDAVKVKAAKRSKNRVAIAVSIGMGWFKGTTFYAGFVEFGHKIGKRGYQLRHFSYVRRGYDSVTGERIGGRVAIKHRKTTKEREDKRQSVEGTHWMRKAFEESEPRAAAKIYEVMRSELAAVAKEKAVN